MKEKINNYIVNTIYFSFVLLPLALISGPLLSDFIISLSAVLFIIFSFVNKEYKYFKNWFFYIFIFFYFWCLICSVFSDYKLVSSLKSLVYFRFFIFALAVWFLFDYKKDLVKYIFYSLFFCFLILVVDGYIQYFTGENIIGYKMHNVRISSFFGDELIFGSYLSRLLPILIALFYLSKISKIRKYEYIFIVFLIFASVIIFLSGERSSFLFVIFTFFYLIFMPNKYSKYLLFLVILLFSIISIFSIQDKRISDRMFKLTFDQAGITDNFSYQHKGHFLIALDLFKSNKFFGVGPKNFQNHCRNNLKYQKLPYVCTSHPHNTYFQLLSETGLVGFFIIFSIFLYLCFLSIKHIYLKIRDRYYYFEFPRICIMASMLISLWPVIPTGSFFNNYINIIYFFPVGIFLWLENRKID